MEMTMTNTIAGPIEQSANPLANPSTNPINPVRQRQSKGYSDQEGSIVLLKGKKGSTWYIKYREAGQQKTTKLARKDDTYHSEKTVRRLLANGFMAKVNAQETQRASGIVSPDATVITVTDFWTNRFLPYCETEWKGEGMKTSTVYGYKQVWRQHLSDHFGNRTLLEYTTADGTAFLRELASARNGNRQGKNTIKHVKALGTAIFTLAVNEVSQTGLKVNPWRDVVLPNDLLKSKEETAHYTLEETEDMISALVDHVDCQLILALTCFFALRPNEAAALKWEDIDSEGINIRRGIVRGVIGVPKTKASIRTLPLIPQVRIPLELWRTKCGNPTTGWVFASENPDRPTDFHNVIARIIVPHVEGKTRCIPCNTTPEKSGVKWKGLYAGRRGGITMAVELAGPAIAQKMAGHKSLTTTLNIYDKGVSDKGFLEGMQAYGQKALTAGK
jgi:integrase